MECFPEHTLEDNASVSMIWDLDKKEKVYGYSTPLPYSDDYQLRLTATYNVKENRLIISPLYLQNDGEEATRNFHR